MGAWDVTQGVGDVLTPHSGEINPIFLLSVSNGNVKASGAERGRFYLVPQSRQMGKQSKPFLPYSPDMASVS